MYEKNWLKERESICVGGVCVLLYFPLCILPEEVGLVRGEQQECPAVGKLWLGD